ncbi:MAG: hypothetical protein N2746_04350 [Deltaproteobacteria bacterium]|nr:hypothetical protein [Deltaproteobacteria bacterium]
MRRNFLIVFLLLLLLSSACATTQQENKSEIPVVNIKKLKVEDAIIFHTPEPIREFVKSTPKYSNATLLANELIGDMEIRKRFENYGYAPYVVGDLDSDGKDEYAFVILSNKTPELVIIKKNMQDEWKEQFSMRLSSYAQIKLSDPSIGIFGNPCVIVTNTSLKAVSNVCWDGIKYISVDY